MTRAMYMLFLAIAVALPTSAGTPKAFFDGKTFDGWEGLIDDYWSIKDGALVGSAPKGIAFNTFLCSKRKFKDFELSFQIKVTKGANSGVQIRSEIFDTTKFAVKGPQCDIGQKYWGSLYGEHTVGMMKEAPKELIPKIVKEGDWNSYAIRAVGKRITIKLNGETTVDQNFPIAPDEGIIAWQIHSGGPIEVIFKDIAFREIK